MSIDTYWQPLKGLIDEVAIYKRALTAEEIAVHYAAGVSDPNAPASPVLDTVPAVVGSSTIVLSGTKPADTSIWVNNKKIVALDSLTTWQGNYGTLQAGPNILNVTAVDSSYRQSQAVIKNVFYDNVPPVISSSVPANNSNTAKAVNSVTINLYDANAGVDAAGSTQNATVKNSAGQLIAGSWTTSGTNTIIFTPNIPFPADTYTVAIFPVDTVGNRQAQPQQIVFTNHDTSAPTTKATLAGAKDSAGWYSTPVTVTLSTDDTSDGSGIARIEYSLDNAVTWQTYTTPLVIDTDGKTTLQFRATDNMGNVESAKSQEIKINKTGLVGWWKMDGDWKDSSLMGNDLTPTNGPTFNSDAKIGTMSAKFNGSNTYLRRASGNCLPLGNSPRTFMAWIKPFSYPDGTYNGIVAYGQISSITGVGSLLSIKNDGRLSMAFWGDDAYQTIGSPATLNQWNHVAFTYDGGITVKFYMNGQFVQESSLSAGVPANTRDGSLRIGSTDDPGRVFNGLIDEVSIYNRPLSDTEIQQLYRNYVVNSPTVNPVTSPTNVATITLSGTKPANTAIVLNGSVIVPLDGTTAWQATYTLSPGLNNLSITAMDSQNFNSLPVTLSVALDITPPQVSATTPVNFGILKTVPSAITFSLIDAFSPLDLAASITGATVKNAGLDVSGAWTTSGSGLTGSATFTASSPMGEGTYTATIKPTDTLGNSTTHTLSFTVDMTAPVAPSIDQITVPINTTAKTITGGKSSDSAQVTVTCPGSVVGTVTYPTGATWSVAVSGLHEGPNTVTAYALDAAGNQSGTATMTFTVDITAPAKPVITAPVSPTKNTSVTLTGGKEANTYLYINNVITTAAFADTAWSFSANLSEGSNSFTVYAKDAAGNQGQSAGVSVYRDTTPPVISASTPTSGAVITSANSISVTLTDAAGGAGVDLQASLEGAVVKDAAGTVINGAWSVSGQAIIFTPSAQLAEGKYTVTIYPADTLGNKGSATISFTIDQAPPTVTTLALSPASPVKAGTVTFTITFSEAMDKNTQPAVTLSGPSSRTLTGSWQSDGKNWTGSYPFTAATGDGSYSVTVSGAKDQAGNIMASQTAGSFTLDTTAPAAPTVAAVTTPTKIATQTITGAKAADTAVIINNVQRVALNSAAAWSYSYPLAEGNNTLTIVARDAAGNDSAAITPAPVITLDTTPPLFTIDTYTSPSPTVTQTISGKKEAGCIVKMNGTTIFDAADQNATWSYVVTLTDGINNHLVFTAADSLGNTTTKTLDILCDTAPPQALAIGMLVASGSGKGSEVTLTWPSYIEPADLAYYRIYSSTADFTTVTGLTPIGTVNKGTKTYKAGSLTKGATYWFAVVPVSASGNADSTIHTASAIPTDTLPPEDITGLASWAGYTAADGNTITLSWTGSVNSTGDLADQIVYIDAGQGYDAGTPAGMTATTYTRKGLNDATLYKFKITTKDTLGHESAGVVVTAATRLANPTGLTATPGSGKVTLAWNAVASPYVKLYNIYRIKSDSSQTDVTGMTLIKGQTGTTFTDTGLTNGATYQYAVTTLNTSGAERTTVQSVAVAPRGDTTGPVISGLNITANKVIIAPFTITAAAQDTESSIDRIELTIDGVLAKSATGASLSWPWNVVTGAIDGNHTIKISAYDVSGNLTEQTIPVVVSLAPPATPAITGHSVTAASPAYIVTVNGTSALDTTVSLRVNGVAVGQPVQVTAAGAFTLTGIQLVEGNNILAVKAAHRGGESPYSTDYLIAVDTGSPNTPTGLSVKALAGGGLQFSWLSGTGETPSGFNLYEANATFTSRTDSGVHKTNSAPITYLLKEYIPADDNPRYYGVTALDGAGNESPISNVISIASDRLAPTAAVAFTTGTGTTPSDNTYGPGAIGIALTVSEALKETPFLSLEPQSGVPIVVALQKTDDTHYSAGLSVDATLPHGPTTWKFSGKDLTGNRGNSQGTGPTLDVRGPQAAVTAPLTLLKTTVGPVAVSVTLDEPSTITPVMGLSAQDGSSAPITGLASTDNIHWSGSLDPANLGEGTGRFTLSDSRDRFNNRGASVTSGANITIYKTTPSAPSVPMGLTAKSFKGGEARLAWMPVTDAQSYNLYRKGTGDATPLKVATVAGSTATTYSEKVAPDGPYAYSISSVGLVDAESAQSAPVTVVTDATPPPAPGALTLTMTGNGVKGEWQAGAGEASPFYRLYRSSGAISDITGLTPVATVNQPTAFDPSPDPAKRFYAVTSLDALGNESAPSDAPEINFPVMPVRNLVAIRVDDGKPALSWEAGEANLQGFYIYRNGAKVNQTPTTSTTYNDGYYAGGSITYGVSAVNSLGSESPVREATLPEFGIGLKDGTLLRRGVLENIVLTASLPQGSANPLTLNAVTLKIGALPESTESGPFIIPVDKPLEIAKVAATEATAPPQTAVVVTAVMTPVPGVTVKLTRSLLAGVIASGSPLEIFNETLVRGTQAKVRIKVTNTGSAGMEFISSTGGGASAQARVILRDQDNNILAQGSLAQRAGLQVVDSGAYATVRLEPGESFLSDPVTFAVPSNAPYKVSLEADIDNTYYHYKQDDQVTAPGFKASIDGAIADVSYTASAVTDKQVYKQGEQIIITGSARSTADSTPMANVPVKIGVSVKGFDRFATITTDNAGNFSYTFTPGVGEAGSYSVWAIHPDLSDRTVQAQFSIIGLQISPLQAGIRLLKGQSYDIPVNLVNLGGSPLTSLTFTTNASSGITATPVNTGNPVLNPGENRAITFRVGADQGAPASGYASLDIGTAEGLGNRVDASITTITAIPVITTTPSYIDTGIMRGNQRIENLTIKNTGAETLINPRIEGPSLSWLVLTSDKNIGDIPSGQSRTVGILIKPDDTMTQGVYNDRLVIYADNHIPYNYNIQVTVTSSAVGSVQFSVLDELMKDVSGATITFQNQSVLELILTVKTDISGSATVFDLPEGRYSYNISAPGALPTSGSFIITPGTTASVPIALELSLVKIEWSVTPVVIEDRYDIQISQTYETNVPTPVLVIEPAGINIPDLQPGRVFNGEFTVSNYGLIALDNVSVSFPNSIDDYDIELMTTTIPKTLGAMQKVTVPYRITRRVTTAYAPLSITGEIGGFGGGTCYNSKPLYTVKGTAVICPNTPQQKTIEKSATHYGSFPYTCGTTTGGPTSVTPSGGTYTGASGGWSSQNNGVPGAGTSTPLPQNNLCNCVPDGDCCDNGPNKCIGDVCTPVTLEKVDAKVNGKKKLKIVQTKSLKLNFKASPTGSNCEYQYNWNFGDGGSSQSQSPSHRYILTGKYSIDVNVSCKKCSPPKVTDNVEATVGFLVTCYIVADENDCTGNTIDNPNGLAGTYCENFLRNVRMQGSGRTRNGTLVQIDYSRGNYITSFATTYFHIVNTISTTSGNQLSEGVSIAVDPSIIALGDSVSIDTIGNRQADDTGRRIKGYHIDIFGGYGKSACSRWSNPILPIVGY